ncbi:hypothetical protein QAD02_000269 [Eretmocerus hayati]|uniref:Uncharacterized protein n=1 Tax=Eretmocerus hayati TaxID=131215 RepID=A0ACC2NCY5_9HYME|nr:hypothetical protein QAD02_000269 [Eretmocerus hayati]
MKLQFLWCVAAAVLVSVCGEKEESEGARLLVAKHVLNKYLVEDMDVVVKYTVHNIGDSAALEVEITDKSFDSDNFAPVSGEISARFDRVPPKTNVTHTVVVRPTKPGYFNFTSAEVLYRKKEDAPRLQVAASSEPGMAYFTAYKEYDKRFSSHVIDWAAFAVMTLPSLAIPFALWFSSKRKYEKLSKNSKKH